MHRNSHFLKNILAAALVCAGLIVLPAGMAVQASGGIDTLDQDILSQIQASLESDETETETESTEESSEAESSEPESTVPESSAPQQDPATQEERDAAKEQLRKEVEKYNTNSNKSSILAEASKAYAQIEEKKEWTKGELDSYVSGILQLIGLYAAGGTTPSSSTSSSDQNSSSGSQSQPVYIDDDMRARADEDMLNYKETLIRRENPEQYILDELDRILYSGIYYIAESEHMTESEMWEYVSQVKAEMDTAVGRSGEVTSTTEFLTLADNWRTPSVSYNGTVSIVLPLINLGEEWLTDLLVEPVVSNDVKEWPFKPDSTGYTQNFNEIPGCATHLYDEAMFNRREVTYTFTAREDVLTGYYPLTFRVWYSRDGIRCEEPAEVSVYVYCQGKPGSGRIGMSDQDNVSKPRIIVTGFTTEPTEVYAGDIFMLTLRVQNTSPDTAVNNVLFELESVESGVTNSNGTVSNSYSAFLPTSGSNSVYVEQMPAGSEKELAIEMQAKADLSQRPYVVKVKMTYDTDLTADLTGEANVSIPVKQEAKFDHSTPEVMPTSIMVGEQSNVMFQIYNTGKTTLYNVQVKFEADSVTGGDAFIGNLEPGATGNVDTMVTGSAATMDDGTVKAVITYEDDTGKPTRTEVEISLMVTDMPMDSGLVEFPEDEAAIRPQPTLTTPKIVMITAGAAVAAAIVAMVIVKLLKKKKAKKRLEEDLLDLDKEDGE